MARLRDTFTTNLVRLSSPVLVYLWLVQGIEGAANVFRALWVLSLLAGLFVVAIEGILAAHEKPFELQPEPWPPARFLWSCFHWGVFIALIWLGHFWTAALLCAVRALMRMRRSIHTERRRTLVTTGGTTP